MKCPAPERTLVRKVTGCFRDVRHFSVAVLVNNECHIDRREFIF